MEATERISIGMPPVPSSFMGFVEDTVRHERKWMLLIESPLKALELAGVPVDPESLTLTDVNRLIGLIYRLRTFVGSGALKSEFDFEKVFGHHPHVWQQTEGSHQSCNQNFEQNMECFESQHSASHDTTNGPTPTVVSGNEIWAPMLSPGDLAAILVKMDLVLQTAQNK